MPGASATAGRAGDEESDDARDRHRDREALDPGDLVADRLREQDVRRRARRGGEREAIPPASDGAVEGCGEEDHADGGGRRRRSSRIARARSRRRAARGTRAARRPEGQASEAAMKRGSWRRYHAESADATSPVGGRRSDAAGRTRGAGRPPTRGEGPRRPRADVVEQGPTDAAIPTWTRPSPRARWRRRPAPGAAAGRVRRVMGRVNRTQSLLSTSTSLTYRSMFSNNHRRWILTASACSSSSPAAARCVRSPSSSATRPRRSRTARRARARGGRDADRARGPPRPADARRAAPRRPRRNDPRGARGRPRRPRPRR